MDQPKQKVFESMYNAFPHLATVQMNKFSRKYLIQGNRLSGKTRILQDIYDRLKDTFGLQYIQGSGFKTGDLRRFNYDHAKYVKKEKVTPFDFFKEEAGGGKENYGIFTMDGIKQAKGFPFWEEPYKEQIETNKQFLEVAMGELDKKSNVYFIDEIGDRQLFSKELQTKIIEKMDDPNCFVIATIQKDSKELFDSKHFDYTNYIKQMQSTELFQIENEKQGRDLAKEIFQRIENLPDTMQSWYL